MWTSRWWSFFFYKRLQDFSIDYFDLIGGLYAITQYPSLPCPFQSLTVVPIWFVFLMRKDQCTYFDFCLFHGLNHKRICCFLRFFPHRTLQTMFPNSLTEAHHCILSKIYINSILKIEMPIGYHWQDKRDYFRPLPRKKLYGHDPQTVTNPNM